MTASTIRSTPLADEDNGKLTDEEYQLFILSEMTRNALAMGRGPCET